MQFARKSVHEWAEVADAAGSCTRYTESIGGIGFDQRHGPCIRVDGIRDMERSMVSGMSVLNTTGLEYIGRCRAAIVPNRDLAPEEQSELDDATLRDAFNLFDLTGNQSIDKSEFKVGKANECSSCTLTCSYKWRWVW